MIVRVRGVKRVRNPRTGRFYFYHRKSGERIAAAPGTSAFAAEVERLDAGARPSPERQKARTGTLGALLSAYQASVEFGRLADRTRADYLKVIDYLSPLDAMPIMQLDSAAVIAIRDKAYRQKKRRFANHVLQVLGTILSWGRPRKLAPSVNPAAGLPKIPRPRELPRANRPWAEEETAAVLNAAAGGLHVALGLAAYVGMRGGDIVRVSWGAYDGNSLTWRQGKTGAEVWLPCLPELRAILDAAPRTATTIATRQDGHSMTEAGLRKAFRTLILRLLKAGAVQPGLTLHGCRHTLGDELMAIGAELGHVQAVLGQKSIAAAQHYSAGADRRRKAQAAITLLENARRTKMENGGG